MQIESMRGAVQLTNYRIQPEDFRETPDGMVVRIPHHFHERWVGTELYSAHSGCVARANIRCVDDATIEVLLPKADRVVPRPVGDYILTVIA